MDLSDCGVHRYTFTPIFIAKHSDESNAKVAEWQTRWTQNPVSARTCGFDSHLWY